MNNFVMRQHKNIIFTVCILHRKRHHMMCIFTEIRIKFHVLRKIVHPSHIPFQAETKAVVFGRSCHLRPCRRFFRDHHSAFVPSQNNRIQMFKEIDRLKILVASVFVRDPLSVLFSVIKIEHRRNSIHTEPVHMEMFDPE